MEDYFKEYGGAVLSSTFDKYCYVTVRQLPKFFEYSTELSYSKIERVNDIEDINHPAIREAMKLLNVRDIRLTYEADLPARSGLGTSSSFAVGMINAFYTLKGQKVDRKTIADDAIYLERVLCDEKGGWQDQIAAAFGGFNKITFDKDGYIVNPIQISQERKQMLNENLLMFFTGFTRLSSDIQKENDVCGSVEKKQLLKEIKGLVDEAADILSNDNSNLDDFGRMLDVTWQLKKGTGNSVSTSDIDVLYSTGIKAGALGGKLLGAGGGGFLVYYAPKEKHDSIASALNGLMRIPFAFENDGTQVIFNNHTA